jgi:hypothetical protein
MARFDHLLGILRAISHCFHDQMHIYWVMDGRVHSSLELKRLLEPGMYLATCRCGFIYERDNIYVIWL